MTPTEALFDAVAKKDSTAASVALGAGGDILGQTPLGETIWPAAVSAGLPAVQFALELGADPNCCDALGRNSLYWAVQADDPQVAVLLIDKGALVVSADREWSALHEAVIAEHYTVLASIAQKVSREVLLSENSMQRTALEEAERNKLEKAVQILRRELHRKTICS